MNTPVRQRVSRFFFAATAFAAVAILGGGDLLAQTTPGPQPSLCLRSCWSARSGSASEMSALNRAIIHHTAGSGDYNVSSINDSKPKVRAVQNLHMDSNGWSDIGYHFLVDRLGNTFEGRVRSANTSQRPKGTHDSNNTNSFGFNVMGYYHPPFSQSFTTASRNAMWNVIAWRMPSGWSPYGSGTYNGKTVGRTAGHRNVKSTACPGDGVYATIGTNFNGGEARNAIAARRTPGPPQGFPENVAMTTDATGRIWFAHIKDDGFVYTRHYTPSTNTWGNVFRQEGMSNVAKRSGVAIVGHANGDVLLFAVNVNGQMRTKLRTGGWPSTWSDFGGSDWSTETAPVAVLRTNDRVSMAGVSAGGALRTRTWVPSTGWSSFTEHGLATWSPRARPALVGAEDGTLWLIATKSNGDMHSRFVSPGGSWSAFTSAGAGWSPTGGAVGLQQTASGNISFAAIKSNGNLYHTSFSGGSWGALQGHGSDWFAGQAPGFTIDPNDGRVYIFGVKDDGKFRFRSWISGQGSSGATWFEDGDNMGISVGATAVAVPGGGVMYIGIGQSTTLYSRLGEHQNWGNRVNHTDGWVK